MLREVVACCLCPMLFSMSKALLLLLLLLVFTLSGVVKIERELFVLFVSVAILLCLRMPRARVYTLWQQRNDHFTAFSEPLL